MQVTVTSNLREKLDRAKDPALRKALKAAIYLEVERGLEEKFGKAFLDMPSTTVWASKGVQRVSGRYGYRRDARKTRRNYSLW
jgi:hypothetical protein